jgi:hypothetical protein
MASSSQQPGNAGKPGTLADSEPEFYETTKKRLVDAESKLETYRKVLVDESSGLTEESRESLRASVEVLEGQVAALKSSVTQLGEFFV